MTRTLVLLLLAAAALPAQEPEYAFVVVIDGLRNDEGFEAESTYLPRIWNELRPLGTVNSRFWNRGWTSTTPGHTTILSGAYQIHANNDGLDQIIRATEPLMFEYFRHYNSEPESACGVVLGKWGNCGEVSDFGLEPAFGERFGGFRLQDPARSEDTVCSRLVHEAMDSLHPKLVLVNLRSVDEFGHTGVYEDYVDAIAVADSIVREFWAHIQAEPPWTDTFYRDRTVLIVTGDHGRNDDAHGGFAEHGNWDHGCRDIVFLALGPGIAAGRSVDSVARDQADIVPTLGAMLGFPTPFAQGEVMEELFAEGYRPRPVGVGPGPPGLGDNISANGGFSRDPDVCRDRFGNLHLVWMDNSSGRWTVMYSQSGDRGQSWQMPARLFDFRGQDSVMRFARVAADDSVAVAATGWGRHACPVDSLSPPTMDTTYLWYPWVATSTNQGASWSTVSLMDSNMGCYSPAIAVHQGRQSLAWGQCGKFGWEATTDGIQFNDRIPDGSWDSLPTHLARTNVRNLSLHDDGVKRHLAGTALWGSDWDVVYASSRNGVDWEMEWAVEDPGGAPAYDYGPEIGVGERGVVHMAWARKPNEGGWWKVMYGRRDPMRGGWDTTSLTRSGLDAWQPHLAVKGDTVAAAWTDYRDGNPEVYVSFSVNRGMDWSEPGNVSGTQSFSHRPRLCALEQGFYVVWQDIADGDWDVYGRQVDVVGIREERTKVQGQRTSQTVVRGVLRLEDGGRETVDRMWLMDVTGREVMELRVGENDFRGVSPGVYFIHPKGPARGPAGSASRGQGFKGSRKVIIQH